MNANLSKHLNNIQTFINRLTKLEKLLCPNSLTPFEYIPEIDLILFQF